MISTSNVADRKIFSFDEFRSDLQKTSTTLDETIKHLKTKDEEGDASAKALLYLFQGAYLIIEGEKKYRAGDYSGASLDYTEGEKMIGRFQRMSAGFSIEYLQAAERIDLLSKGRKSECLALKEGTKVENQIDYLLEAINSYILEAQINQKNKNPLLYYNAKAREFFARGLSARYEGEDAFLKKNLVQAKKKHLEAYRAFTKAAYYNPSYSIWIQEQNNSIRNVMLSLLEKKASDNWKLAYKLSNEGKFLESSERCLIASKLFLRASNKSTDMKKAKLFYSYSFMLQASKQEAIANNALKKQNDAKGSIRPFELAANALKQAIESYPNREDTETLNRWQAQQQYYLGHNFQSQGIFLLDSEKYQEALKLFNQAEEIFNEANKFATNTNDKALIKLIDKSIAEAKGYIGMCKTVLD